MTIDFQSTDNTPDVKIKSYTYQHRLTEDNGSEGGIEIRVKYEVHCKYCGGYYMTSDVRRATKWADTHEISIAHVYAKEEQLKNNL